jgi:hypothetical protein
MADKGKNSNANGAKVRMARMSFVICGGVWVSIWQREEMRGQDSSLPGVSRNDKREEVYLELIPRMLRTKLVKITWPPVMMARQAP